MKFIVNLIKSIFLLVGTALYVYPISLIVLHKIPWELNSLVLWGICWCFGFLSVKFGQSIHTTPSDELDRNKKE